MYYISTKDVFRFKGQLAECLQRTTTNATLYLQDGSLIIVNINSEEFQRNCSRVNTLKYVPDVYLSINDILNVVCEYFKLPTNFVTGWSRKGAYVTARHITMYLLLAHTKFTLVSIGKAFSNRHHTTVMHARNRIRDLIDAKDLIMDDVIVLEKKIKDLGGTDTLLLQKVV